MITSFERICGEAKYVVIHDGKKVIDAFFISRSPLRGFEKLVTGKSPIFALEAVMRICGICHSAHGIAAAEAFEDALGIAPPANGRILREVIGLINRVQSHLLHLALVLPDLVKESVAGKVMIKVLGMLNTISEVLTRVGGAPTHPPYIVIGGVLKTPTEASLRECIEKSKSVLKEFQGIMGHLSDENSRNERVGALENIEWSPGFLASHLFYGDRYNIDVDDIALVRYESYRDEAPEDLKLSTSLIALYKGKPVEVGPRARLAIYKDFNNTSVLGIQLARLGEIELALRRVIDLLEQVNVNSPSRTYVTVFRRGRGVEVYEAPRGVLVHSVELDSDGRVASYRIITPTNFNIPVMEACAKDVPLHLAEVIPRIYDPCIPCATHLVRVLK